MKFFKMKNEIQQPGNNQARRFTLGQYIAAVSALLLSVTAFSYAAGLLTTLVTFTSGSSLSSSDVNGNFDKINVQLAAMTAAGSVVQMKSVQTREQGLYSASVGDNGTAITPLNIVITPRKAGNAMVLEWHVNGETYEDAVYIVQRNGVLLVGTTNEANNRWAGLAAQPHDTNNGSTPDNAILRITDFNTLATSTTYTLHIRSSYGVANNLYLNRTFASIVGDIYEHSLSSGTATEIAQ